MKTGARGNLTCAFNCLFLRGWTTRMLTRWCRFQRCSLWLVLRSMAIAPPLATAKTLFLWRSKFPTPECRVLGTSGVHKTPSGHVRDRRSRGFPSPRRSSSDAVACCQVSLWRVTSLLRWRNIRSLDPVLTRSWLTSQRHFLNWSQPEPGSESSVHAASAWLVSSENPGHPPWGRWDR